MTGDISADPEFHEMQRPRQPPSARIWVTAALAACLLTLASPAARAAWHGGGGGWHGGGWHGGGWHGGGWHGGGWRGGWGWRGGGWGCCWGGGVFVGIPPIYAPPPVYYPPPPAYYPYYPPYGYFWRGY